jgi:hypothetical protein
LGTFEMAPHSPTGRFVRTPMRLLQSTRLVRLRYHCLMFDVQQNGREQIGIVDRQERLIDTESKVQGALKDFDQEQPEGAAASRAKP